jgi:hypothetical protein
MDAETLGSLATLAVAQQMIDVPTISNLIFALSSLIAAGTGLASVVQNYFLNKKAQNNARISEGNSTAINAVATKVTAVDVKVDAVTEQTNGHMTSLIAAVSPVDPTTAAAAAAKIIETAERVAERLKETSETAPLKKDAP